MSLNWRKYEKHFLQKKLFQPIFLETMKGGQEGSYFRVSASDSAECLNSTSCITRAFLVAAAALFADWDGKRRVHLTSHFPFSFWIKDNMDFRSSRAYSHFSMSFLIYSLRSALSRSNLRFTRGNWRSATACFCSSCSPDFSARCF